MPVRTPGAGQGQEGMTPQAGGGVTPRGAVTPGLTPSRTPLRDKLNINSEEQLADPAYAKHLVSKLSSFNLFFSEATEHLYSDLKWQLNKKIIFHSLPHTAKRKLAAAEAGTDVTSGSQERL